jgi:hypothetical protein
VGSQDHCAAFCTRDNAHGALASHHRGRVQWCRRVGNNERLEELGGNVHVREILVNSANLGFSRSDADKKCDGVMVCECHDDNDDGDDDDGVL